MTNMSSTPIPISKNGSSPWIPADFPPNKYASPFDDANDRPTHKSAIPAADALKCIGLQPPIKLIQ